MIYQLVIYYGASLNDKVIYTSKTTFNDCKKFPSELNESLFKQNIELRIIIDGFSPSDFDIGYITKEQYENREDIESERVELIKIKALNRIEEEINNAEWIGRN